MTVLPCPALVYTSTTERSTKMCRVMVDEEPARLPDWVGLAMEALSELLLVMMYRSVLLMGFLTPVVPTGAITACKIDQKD